MTIKQRKIGENWEREFDREFQVMGKNWEYPLQAIPQDLKEAIKDFIRELLKAQTSRIVEIVEENRFCYKKYFYCENCGEDNEIKICNHDLIDDILKAIKGRR